jgi:hypothetical protein
LFQSSTRRLEPVSVRHVLLFAATRADSKREAATGQKVQSRRHLGDESWISKRLAQDSVTKRESRVKRREVRQCGEAFENVRVSQLQVVNEPRRLEVPRDKVQRAIQVVNERWAAQPRRARSHSNLSQDTRLSSWSGSSGSGQDGKLMAQQQVLGHEVLARTNVGQPGRKEQPLLDAGSLEAVDTQPIQIKLASVRRRLQRVPPVGAQLAPLSAWAVLALATGDAAFTGHVAGLLADPDRSRPAHV